MLRRDRIRLPAWVAGLTLLLAYFVNALGLVVDETALKGFAALTANPVMTLIGGPGYGFDEITLGRFIVGLYGVYLMIGAGLMSILTVSRHTRAEEQSGRAELVRAGVVGRRAQLAAAIILSVAMNGLMVLLMSFVFHFSPAEPDSFASSLLFTTSIGMVGLAFTGVGAVTVQLSPSSRAGSGLAGALLAASFLVRGFGDMSSVQGGRFGWLSWLSPFGWSQQTAPLTLDRWWPLAISAILTVGAFVLAFTLQDRRDLGAGILAERLGPDSAAGSLTGPVSMAFRLQRSALLWWSFSIFVAGLVFGGFVQTMADNASAMPEEILAVIGGAETMVNDYLGFMGLYFAIFVSVQAILSVQQLRAEEQSGRTEPLLATAISRTGWLFSWALVAAAGAVWLLFLAGLGEGLGSWFATAEASLVKPVVLGHLAHTPAVLVLLAIAIALHGTVPRLLGLTWVVCVTGAALALFGDMLQLGRGVLAVSVFRHIGQYPGEGISWASVTVLSLIAVTITVIGLLGYRNRDLTTK